MLWPILAAAALTSPNPASRPVICLDPGHPSENGRGSKGKSLSEMEVAWQVAGRLRGILTNRGYVVVLTKNGQEEAVTNRRRAEIANAAGAALLLRLHCDAASGSGIATYYPKDEGVVGGQTGPSADVRQRSGLLAKPFHAALIRALEGRHADRGLMTDRQTLIGGRQGALTGSVFSKVPVLLVEMAVLTHPKDEAFLRSKQGFEALCRALAAGVAAAVPPTARFVRHGNG